MSPRGRGRTLRHSVHRHRRSDIIYTLPASLTPTSAVGAGILQTDASGNLSWLSPTALAAATAWALTGNSITSAWNGSSGSFLGTTNAQPLVIATTNTTSPQPIQVWVGNQETFRFNPPGTSAPAWSIQRGGGNQRGLHAVDLQSARSAATQVASGDYSVISGGRLNTASGGSSTVGGGENNIATSYTATVSGGLNNSASNASATVGGGQGNTASGLVSTVGGGQGNTASGQYATVGGGVGNTASGQYATVGGGVGNTASGNYATVGGGQGNTASGIYSAIPGGAFLQVGTRSFGFSGQTSVTQTDLSANSNIAAFVDVDLWLYSRDFTNASQLRFYEAQAHGSGANYVALRAPTGLSANTTYTLPADLTTTNTVATGILQTDASGNLSWLSPTALAAATAWALTGNSITSAWNGTSGSFLGTTNAQPLVIATTNTTTPQPIQFWTGNTERMRITATGNVGIGTAAPTERLQVSDGNIAITNTDNTARQLRLYEPSGAGTNFTAFRAQAQASDIIYTLPASLTAGTLASGGRILQSDGGGNLSWLDPAALAAATAWALTGNSITSAWNGSSGNFLGTTNAQPLVIATTNTTSPQPIQVWVGNQETFRFNPPGTSAPAWSIQRGGGNQRGLHAVDLQSARSAATEVASGDYSVIGGGWRNTASGQYATVSGGQVNTASAFIATVGGGSSNTASGLVATVGGGTSNTASGAYATVGGGISDTASGYVATVGGGAGNTASGQYATVGGGRVNTASGDYSAIPGGNYLRVGNRSFGFSGQTSQTQTDLSADTNIAAFVDVDLWLYSRDRTQASQLRFYEAQAHSSGANYVALRAPTGLPANTTYTLPANAPATAAWLQSDNTGAMSWRPVLYGVVSVNRPAIGANTSTTFTVTITGVQTNDLVFLTPPSDIEPGLVFQGASVTAANTVTIRMRNVTGTAIAASTRTWSYMVIRP
jgi:hypothetical protein